MNYRRMCLFAGCLVAATVVTDAFVIRTTVASTKSAAVAFQTTTAVVSRVPPAFFVPTCCLRAEKTQQTEREEDAEFGDEMSSGVTADDILNSPAFLARKVDVLKSDIAKVEEKISDANDALEAGKAEWGSQLDGLQKEYLNIQERMAKQGREGRGVAIIEVVRKFLDVLDNYNRAFGAVTAETDEEREIEAAYQKTRDMILDTFTELGIVEVETLGKEFDYEIHQAVMMRPSEDYDEGIVCEELSKGYRTKDGTLIRAAMVSVAN